MACSSSPTSLKKARPSRAKVRRRDVKASSLLRWVARARGKGMTARELVADLHVRRGLPVRKVAGVLGLGVEVVREQLKPQRARVGSMEEARQVVANLPEGTVVRTEADMRSMRARMGVVLWETVVTTFQEEAGAAGAGDENGNEGAGLPGAVSGSPRPPMLSMRIRALTMLAKLHGISLSGKKKRASEREVVSQCCATPAEIAESVREWLRREGKDQL